MEYKRFGNKIIVRIDKDEELRSKRLNSGCTGQAERITQRDISFFLPYYTFGRCQSLTSFTSSYMAQ